MIELNRGEGENNPDENARQSASINYPPGIEQKEKTRRIEIQRILKHPNLAGQSTYQSLVDSILAIPIEDILDKKYNQLFRQIWMIQAHSKSPTLIVLESNHFSRDQLISIGELFIALAPKEREKAYIDFLLLASYLGAIEYLEMPNLYLAAFPGDNIMDHIERYKRFLENKNITKNDQLTIELRELLEEYEEIATLESEGPAEPVSWAEMKPEFDIHDFLLFKEAELQRLSNVDFLELFFKEFLGSALKAEFDLPMPKQFSFNKIAFKLFEVSANYDRIMLTATFNKLINQLGEEWKGKEVHVDEAEMDKYLDSFYKEDLLFEYFDAILSTSDLPYSKKKLVKECVERRKLWLERKK